MHPYRDNIIHFPKILRRMEFPLEEILDITPEDYCNRIGIDLDYYVKFRVVYSCNDKNSISVPEFTETVVNHGIFQDKRSMYCVCIAMIPKSSFVY